MCFGFEITYKSILCDILYAISVLKKEKQSGYCNADNINKF